MRISDWSSDVCSSDLIAKDTQRGEIVGLLLPTAAGAAVSFFALSAYGRVPAMLNFTAGSANLLSACRTAQIATVYTSRRFIEKATLEAEAEALAAQVRRVYLEDLRREIGLFAKLRGLPPPSFQLGRASCRERECQYV